MSHILSRDTLLDITHEALLRNWDKLQLWAWEEHEREIILREMLAQLDKWLKNNRDTQYLLSAGSLSYFEKWWTGIEVNKAMWMRRYLDGGIRHDDLADKERKTQNAKHKKQEIEEYLADSRKYHNRKKRIQQIAIGIICLLLVIAVAGLIYSLNLQRKISVTSLSNSIATKAYRTLEKDPTLAFRLAEQAYKIAPEPLAKEVLMASYGEMPFYQVLRGHTDGVNIAKFSHNGNYIISGSHDKTVKIWDKYGKLLRTLIGHKGSIWFGQTDVINFSPDDNLIITCSQDSTARIWEVKTGKCLAILIHKKAVNTVVFSSDGTKILTSSSDKTAKLWDLSGKELVVFKGHTKGVKLAKFSPDGTKILTASGDSTARLWDLEGRELVKIKGESSFYGANFSPNGKKIITGDAEKNVSLWTMNGKKNLSLDGQKDVEFSNFHDYFLTRYQTINAKLFDSTGNEISILRGHTAKLWQINFSPNGRQILTASDDGTARLWDLNGTELMVLKGHTDQVNSANFSPDGNYVVTASGDKTARIWNIKPRENPVLKGHTAWVRNAAFSPNGKDVATAGWDYTMRLWANGSETVSPMQHKFYVVDHLAFSPNGKYILTSNRYSFEARLWNTSGKLIQILKHNATVFLSNTPFSMDGKMILTLNYDNSIAYLWSLSDSAKKVHEFKHVFSAEFSPDNQYILTSEEDSLAKVYDLRKIKIDSTDSMNISIPQIVLKGHKGSILASWSQDGKYVVTWSDDSIAKLWNNRGKFLLELSWLKNTILLAKFSSNGKYILTISQDNTGCIWNLEGKIISILKGHNDAINYIDSSPINDIIITCSRDQTVRLWNLKGEELQTFTNHKGAVWQAKFSPDGKYILTASDDHTARIMPVSVEMVLEKINKEKVRGEVMELNNQELEIFGVNGTH